MKIAMRDVFGTTLAQLAVHDEKVVVLNADLSSSTKTDRVKEKTPKQHFNIGIAEGNMMCIAAGMAIQGNIAFVSGFAMFLCGRAYEQIRNSIAYPNLNVKICATHAGLSAGEDGATHQAIEDINLMRGIPNMVVLCPADAYQAKAALEACYTYRGPCYLRMGREPAELVYSKDDVFQIGKGKILKKGSQLAIIACGIMVYEALLACEELKKENIFITVIDMGSIKPLDEALICSLLTEHHIIITVEEHSIIGGLGSAVSEVLSQYPNIQQSRIGIQDTFGESGIAKELMEKHGLTSNAIINKVKSLIK